MLASPYKTLLQIICLTLFAGIIHISTILAIPNLTQNSIWEKVKSFSHPGKLVAILDEAAPPLWPFQSKSLYYAICRYDLNQAPMVANFRLKRETWSIAAYNEKGENFYTVDGFDLQRNEVSLLINMETMPKIENNILHLKPLSPLGFLVLRVPKEAHALNEQFKKIIQDSECRTLDQSSS